jgi:hypothetical protein
VREPQWRDAARGVGLVADPVSGLLSGRAVVAQAVGLDDEAEVGPPEVDLEAVDVGAGRRLREPGLADK